MDLCLVANSKSSSTKGCSVPPIIQLKQVKLNIRLLAQTASISIYLQVGEQITYTKVKAMPHAIVFLNEEDINSVIIVAGTDLNFVLNDVKEAWEVILKLIAVYYIFDLQYPAAYGLLNLVEQYCLRTSAASSNEAKKRKTKKFKILQDFVVAFEKFRASL